MKNESFKSMILLYAYNKYCKIDYTTTRWRHRMLYVLKFISIFSVTYSFHVLMKTLTDTFTFKVYKSKSEFCVWSLYTFFVAYTAIRFRIYENLSLALNTMVSLSWMLSFYAFAKFNLKSNLKETFKLGSVSTVSMILLDMLTALILFKGFVKLDENIMSFLAVYVEMAAFFLVMSWVFLIDSRRLQTKPKLLNRKNAKLVVIPVLVSFTYYIYTNFFEYHERMKFIDFPIKLVLFNIATLLVLSWLIIDRFRASQRAGAQAFVEIMTDYVHILEGVNGDLRHYKHDIENILFGLREYINTRDLPGLKTYFSNEVKAHSPSQDSISCALRAMKPLKINVLKGAIIRALYDNKEGGHTITFHCSDIEDTSYENLEIFSIMAGSLLGETLRHLKGERIKVSFIEEPSLVQEQGPRLEIESPSIQVNEALKTNLMAICQPYVQHENIKIEALCKGQVVCRIGIGA